MYLKIEEKNTTIKKMHLEKSLVDITGFGDITNVGLPKGRKTLVCGSTGSGKTLVAMES